MALAQVPLSGTWPNDNPYGSLTLLEYWSIGKITKKDDHGAVKLEKGALD